MVLDQQEINNMSNSNEPNLTTICYNIPVEVFKVVVSLCTELQDKYEVTVTTFLDNSNIDIRFKEFKKDSYTCKKIIIGTHTDQFIIFATSDISYLFEHLPKLGIYLKTVEMRGIVAGVDFKEGITKKEEKIHKHNKDFFETKPVVEDRGTHYRFSYKGVHLDPARIALIYGITNPMQFQALKKILCAGKRGHKDTNADIKDIACAINRWQELLQDE